MRLSEVTETSEVEFVKPVVTAGSRFFVGRGVVASFGLFVGQKVPRGFLVPD